MFRLLKWTAAPALAFAMSFAGDAPQAEAGDPFQLQVGRLGISVGGGHYDHHHHHGYYVPRYRNYYGGHYGRHYYGGYYGGHHGHHRSFRGYHDTSHFDYHPPQLVPHGGHLDYIPGHYHFHREGHYHH